jgi:ABC-type multidrug transport system ATPase subunit
MVDKVVRSKDMRVVLGRDPDSSGEVGLKLVVVDANQVSASHVFIEWDGGDILRVMDLGSTNGTFVNREAEPLVAWIWREVSFRDVLFLGTYRYPLWRLQCEEACTEEIFSRAATSSNDKDVRTIGRASDNDLVLCSPQISAYHAKVQRVNGELYIEDLGSTNGTFVDGQEIRGKVKISCASRVVLGNHRLLVRRDGTLLEVGTQQEIQIDARDLSFAIDGGRLLLDSVSAVFYPGEIIALMGPSGAGKTTLLRCLVGLNQPSSGEVLINGLSLYGHYNRFRGLIGYMPQVDLLYPELTITESLRYAGRIRLPSDWDEQMIDEQIEKVLKHLELWEHRDKMVRVLSGGQLKRVNLAQELITDPPILFLDEPTSGLSSRDSLKLLELLRQLADSGKTIIQTIHQPSAHLFGLMDNLLLLAAGGRLAYYGKTTDAYRYFQTARPEPDELLIALEEQGKPEDWQQRYRKDDLQVEFVTKRQALPTESHTQQQPRVPYKFGFRQWWLLTQRYVRIKLRDGLNTALLLLQAPLIAGLMAAVFSGVTSRITGDADIVTPLFVLSLAALWFGCSNAARELVSERQMFIRERMVNLKLPSYLMSKFCVLAILSLLQCLMLLLISGFWLPLAAISEIWVWLGQLAFLWLTAMSGLALGLLVSASVNSPASASSLLPLLLIPQIVLGGYVVPLNQVSTPIKTASGLTLTRWSFEGLVHVSYPKHHHRFDWKLSLSELQRDVPQQRQVQCRPSTLNDTLCRDAKYQARCDLRELSTQKDLFAEFGIELRWQKQRYAVETPNLGVSTSFCISGRDAQFGRLLTGYFESCRLYGIRG